MIIRVVWARVVDFFFLMIISFLSFFFKEINYNLMNNKKKNNWSKRVVNFFYDKYNKFFFKKKINYNLTNKKKKKSIGLNMWCVVEFF